MNRLSKRSMRPIAAALASLFGLASLDAIAAPAVTNCLDSGVGSLRTSVHDAGEGDVIDMTNLQCSPISLTTGAIAVTRDNLSIKGPGADKLEIKRGGGPDVNVITHYGSGTLAIDHVKISSGYLYMSSTAKYFGGGCVGAFGSLELDYVIVAGCKEKLGDGASGRGGAVFAYGNLTLSHSVVSGSTMIDSYGGGGCYDYYGYYCPDDFRPSRPATGALTKRGGGVFAKGTMTIDHSTLSGNGGTYYGGSIYAMGAATISYSTISHSYSGAGAAIATSGIGALTIKSSTISSNTVTYSFGSSGTSIEGRLPSSGSPQPIRIFNSTIAENGGAVVVNSKIPLAIYNSTIAFNHAPYGYYTGTGSAVSVSNAELRVVSSIIADNFSDDVKLTGTATITGSNSLINFSSATLPTGTLSACAQLSPLADNGGPTKTVALRQNSPAIGVGANPLTFPFDQRGSGYVRQFQTSTDMGSFEWHGDNDNIFANRFDGSGLRCDI